MCERERGAQGARARGGGTSVGMGARAGGGGGASTGRWVVGWLDFEFTNEPMGLLFRVMNSMYIYIILMHCGVLHLYLHDLSTGTHRKC
jgi:hypothetical protein